MRIIRCGNFDVLHCRHSYGDRNWPRQVRQSTRIVRWSAVCIFNGESHYHDTFAALGMPAVTAVFALTGAVGGYLQAWLLDHMGIVPTALALNIAQAVIAVACCKGASWHSGDRKAAATRRLRAD
jgi:hypothetical protein